MSFLSSIGKALGSVGSIVGDALNGITGATSAAQTQQKYTQQNMQMSQGMTLEQMAQSNEYSLQQMAQSYDYALKEMAKNYNYQVNSAKNAIQWQMSDLKKAGLNPILAAGYGGANLGGSVGASGVSGGGASGSMGTGSAGGQMSNMNPMEIINGLTSATKAMTEIDNLEANKELMEAQKDKTNIEAGLIEPKTKQEMKESKSREAVNAKQAENIEADTYNKQATWYKIKEETDQVFWDNIKNQSDVEFLRKYGVTKDQAIKIGESVGKIFNKKGKNKK